MSKEKYLPKIIEWAEKKKIKSLKAVSEGYDAPKSFTNQNTQEQVQPDLSFEMDDATHYSDVALKCEDTRRLVTRWKLNSTLATIMNYLISGALPVNDNDARIILLSHDNYFLNKEGLLFHIPPGRRNITREGPAQLVVPKDLHNLVLSEYHDANIGGHFGFDKAYDKIRRHYYWQNMYADVLRYCRTCEKCARRNSPPKPKGPTTTFPVEGPFDMMGVDVLGPFVPSAKGNRFIVVFTDYYTKYPEAFALPNVQAPAIARLLVEEIFFSPWCTPVFIVRQGYKFLITTGK